MSFNVYVEMLQELPSAMGPAFSNHILVVLFVFMFKQALRATDFQHKVFYTGAEQLARGMLSEMSIIQQNS
jgi:hypothetical protein